MSSNQTNNPENTHTANRPIYNDSLPAPDHIPTERAQARKARRTDSRQMTSIARKIHHSWILKSFTKTVCFDCLLAILLFIVVLIQTELVTLDNFQFSCSRSIAIADSFTTPSLLISEIELPWRLNVLQKLAYILTDNTGKTLLCVPLFPILTVIFALVCVVIIFQIIDFFTSYLRDAKKIRRQLQPLNDIALKADQLSRMHFSEDKYYSADKYQQIEDAISHLQPDESELLSFEDSDLQGIEAAMNNLLIHMRESYQQQARFVNDASHELRTPIAVIQGYANMLSRWGRNDEKILDESITAIQHESEHMKYLVEQLLFLARGDSGRTVLKKEDISLNAMMQEIYEESFMIDEEHPYRFKPFSNEITITADAALLKQAVRILIDNAAKYTNKGDEIFLSYGLTTPESTSDMLPDVPNMPQNKINRRHSQTIDNSGNFQPRPYIQIQDTGIGMAENDVAHMFERFYRSDEVRTYKGTGLGLSIAKWIIDKHQGHFEILSRTDLGTRIKIIL